MFKTAVPHGGQTIGHCEHVRDCVFRDAPATLPPMEQLLDKLLAMSYYQDVCPGVSPWYSSVLLHLATRLESYAIELEDQRDILDEHPLQGPCKRMRMDQDAVDKVHDAVEQGRASSCA